MFRLSPKCTPPGSVRLTMTGFAAFECAFCRHRVMLRTSPNALAKWAMARGAIREHVSTKHPVQHAMMKWKAPWAP